MEQASLPTARAGEYPFPVQFSVFLANRVGQLKDLFDLVAKEGVQVVGISVVDSTDWAVIRALFDDADKARDILAKRALPFTESEVIVLELSGPNSLSSVCGRLLRAEINVHFAYPLMIRRHGNPVMVFHVDDAALAVEALSKHGVTLLGDHELSEAS
jgi:hypothetical protein